MIELYHKLLSDITRYYALLRAITRYRIIKIISNKNLYSYFFINILRELYIT